MTTDRSERISPADRFKPWSARPRRALLIGIDEYLCPTYHRLKGCANDAERIGALLESRFDFASVVLRDAEADRSTILEALTTLLHLARPLQTDDPSAPSAEVVLFWSGHGSRIRSREFGFFESLVAYDSFRPRRAEDLSARNRDLTECELYAWILRLSESGIGITLLIDACHAGGVVRDIAARPRGVRHDRRPNALHDKTAFMDLEPLRTDVRASDKRAVSRPRHHDAALTAMAAYRDHRPPSDRYVLLTSCKDNQLCRETLDDETGNHHGLFSLHLARALQTLHRPMSWRDLADEIGPLISIHNAAQTPQLEGAIDRQIFGRRHLRPRPFLKLRGAHGSRGHLAGGSAHGVVRGSIWHLFSRTAHRPAGRPIARLQIESVEGHRSRGTLTSPSEPVVKGLRAFEHSRPYARQLRVAWTGPPEVTTRARALLSRSVHLRFAAPEHADVEVVWRGSRSADANAVRLPADGPNAPHWVVVDMTNRQLAPARSCHRPSALKQLVADLEIIARQRYLAELTHPRPEISLAAGISHQVHRLGSGGAWSKVQPGGSVAVGDRLALTLERAKARKAEPIHVAVVDLGLAGAIKLVHPRRGRHEAWDTSTWALGFSADDRLIVELPRGYSLPSRRQASRRPAPLETLLILLSRDPSDFDMLSQKGFSPRRETPRSGLAHVLNRVSAHPTQRSGKAPDLLRGPERWGLLRSSFRVTSARVRD